MDGIEFCDSENDPLGLTDEERNGMGSLYEACEAFSELILKEYRAKKEEVKDHEPASVSGSVTEGPEPFI